MTSAKGAGYSHGRGVVCRMIGRAFSPRFLWPLVPRASPWAGIGRAVGAISLHHCGALLASWRFITCLRLAGTASPHLCWRASSGASPHLDDNRRQRTTIEAHRRQQHRRCGEAGVVEGVERVERIERIESPESIDSFDSFEKLGSARSITAASGTLALLISCCTVSLYRGRRAGRFGTGGSQT